ncbi:conserved Plasmodium protein, unknown function [Plasmodium chabaudi chabaudi]|uniref:Uncharacterized protein n=1 Tax=Plasmodium chabaudi chabaudi TaxID=31271 RepID=A0A1C6YR20_PLACU|nr:conserved Plasmodium protein, unknown function [Plasmodium chabaudi chabaudi]
MNSHLLKKQVGYDYYYIKNIVFYKKCKNVKPFSNAQFPKRVGFMKPAFKLNRKAQKYIVNVQWMKSNDTKNLEKLCNNIKKDANLFNSYELIDLVYYLSKITNKNVYSTVEPLLFHFFRKYNTSVNLNGVSIHRLLRVLTEYQDLVYREWIYSIAKIISKKHAHISMRDIQLILDDLALFYDFQIHCQIIPFYNTIINRIHELEIKRLPFLIHVIGRIGCNNKNLLNILYTTLKKNISKNDLYRSDFSGLMLRGLANLKIYPDKNILYQLYKPVKENISYTNIKYLSWCADGFSRLNYFYPLPLLTNQIIKMKDKISQLELNDFTSILNCIQAYILTKQYNTHKNCLKKTDEICMKQKNTDIEGGNNNDTKLAHQQLAYQPNAMINKDECKKMNSIEIETTDFESEESFLHSNKLDNINPNPISESHPEFGMNDNMITIEELYNIYLKLENIILEKVNESIYNSTPPYRVIMFELLTRLFRFYSKPIDLIISMNTHRYDTSLLLKYSNSISRIISDNKNRTMSDSKLSFYVNQYNFSNDFFFANTSNCQNVVKEDALSMESHATNEHQKMPVNAYEKIEKSKQEIAQRAAIDENTNVNDNINTNENSNNNHHDVKSGHPDKEFGINLNVNTPLPKILKNFLYSIYFRTPALGGRTIMLLLIALVRLNFGEREKIEYLNKVNSHILPFSKANEVYRPLTNCLIREIIRKLETFNSEELIICAICLNELDALNLNNELLSLLIDRLFNLNKNNYMSKDQFAQLKILLQFLYFHKRNSIIKNLRFNSIKQFKSFLHP